METMQITFTNNVKNKDMTYICNNNKKNIKLKWIFEGFIKMKIT